MVRPIIHGISRLARTLDTEPLDKEEIDSGTIAFSALMYQYGAMLDARVLVALWLGGVILPRAIERLERDKAREKQNQQFSAANDNREMPRYAGAGATPAPTMPTQPAPATVITFDSPTEPKR